MLRTCFLLYYYSMKRTLAAAAVALAALAPVRSVLAQTTATSTDDPNATVEAQVQSYFSDIPVMIAIAQCESSFRQFNQNGTPLLGGDGDVVGVFQLDESSHANAAQSLGIDIDTTAGNLEYARFLYGFEGTTPWFSSYSCWHPLVAGTSTAAVATTTEAAATSTPALSINLMLGNVDPQVTTLQKMLNADGFTVATSGPGSIGQETDVFGLLTQSALRKFQCALQITCAGDEYTTGYGLLNVQARSALLAFSGSSIVATSTVLQSDESGQIAQLQSQIKALTVVLAQILAARSAHLQ